MESTSVKSVSKARLRAISDRPKVLLSIARDSSTFAIRATIEFRYLSLCIFYIALLIRLSFLPSFRNFHTAVSLRCLGGPD